MKTIMWFGWNDLRETLYDWTMVEKCISTANDTQGNETRYVAIRDFIAEHNVNHKISYSVFLYKNNIRSFAKNSEVLIVFIEMEDEIYTQAVLSLGDMIVTEKYVYEELHRKDYDLKYSYETCKSIDQNRADWISERERMSLLK